MEVLNEISETIKTYTHALDTLLTSPISECPQDIMNFESVESFHLYDLKSSLEAFLRSVFDLADASSRMAHELAEVLQFIIHLRLFNPSFVTDRILQSIQNALQACQKFRNADKKVVSGCLEFPRSRAREIIRRSDQSSLRELKLYIPYAESMIARRALPLEQLLSRLKSLWKSVCFRDFFSSQGQQICQEVLSVFQECFAHASFYSIPFINYRFRIPTVFSYDVTREPQCSLTPRELRLLVMYLRCRCHDTGEAESIFDKDVFQSLSRVFRSSPDTRLRHSFKSIAQSYISAINAIAQGVLPSMSIENQIHSLQTTNASHLIERKANVLHGILKQCCRASQSFASARHHITVTRNQINEVRRKCNRHGIHVLSLEEGSSLSVPLECRVCFLDNLVEHMKSIEDYLTEHQWLITSISSRADENFMPEPLSIYPVLKGIFNKKSCEQVRKNIQQFDNLLSHLRTSFAPSNRSLGSHDILMTTFKPLQPLLSFSHAPLADIVPPPTRRITAAQRPEEIPWIKDVHDSIPFLEINAIGMKETFTWRKCTVKQQKEFAKDSATVKKAFREGNGRTNPPTSASQRRKTQTNTPAMIQSWMW
ncbi:hypothetical protein AN958_01444 [Leucoagaricus sp. SymC.cos]|nr:hypothetical protein AN958_01444 [Leucoagaricus sp. SymC.cos]